MPFLLLAGLFGCNGGNGAQFQFSAQLPAAKPYYQELEAQTRYASVFHQLQRVVAVHAVRLDAGFSSVYSHYVSQYTQPGGSPLLPPPGAGKTQVLVSIFAPVARDMDLDNTRLWALSASPGSDQNPVTVERVDRVPEKKRLSQEFPFVTPWSQEFLVTVPLENVSQIHLKSPSLILSLNW